MSPEEIKERAAAIRLPIAHLAKAAGKAPNTLPRAIDSGRSNLRSTHEAFERALLAEETRLLDYLLKKHGLLNKHEAA